MSARGGPPNRSGSSTRGIRQGRGDRRRRGRWLLESGRRDGRGGSPPGAELRLFASGCSGSCRRAGWRDGRLRFDWWSSYRLRPGVDHRPKRSGGVKDRQRAGLLAFEEIVVDSLDSRPDLIRRMSPSDVVWLPVAGDRRGEIDGLSAASGKRGSRISLLNFSDWPGAWPSSQIATKWSCLCSGRKPSFRPRKRHPPMRRRQATCCWCERG